MIITYHGEGYFRFQSGQLTALLNPTNLKAAKNADIVITTTNPPSDKILKESNDRDFFLIAHQGEYEVKGVEIKGQANGFGEKQKEEFSIYRLVLEEMKIGIVSLIKKDSVQEIINFLGGSDIMIIPVGPPYAEEGLAAKLTRQIGPGFVVPSLYSEKDIKTFLKEMGQETKPEDRLVVKKKDIGEKKTKVVWLKD